MSDPKSPEELQQRVEELEKELEAEKKPSVAWATVTSVVAFILLSLFQYGAYFFIPKFDVIFADIFGPDENLSDSTMIVLNCSRTFKANALILVPVYLLFSVACAGFIGFQRFYFPRHVWISINVLFFILILGLLLGSFIAIILPLINTMNALGT